MSTGSVDSRVPGTPKGVWTATVVVDTAVVVAGAAVVVDTAVVVAGAAVVVDTAVVVAGAAVVVDTAVVVAGAAVVVTAVVAGTAVVPVDEEQPAADTAQARRNGTNAGVGRTARPFRNRLHHESPPGRPDRSSRVSDDPMPSQGQRLPDGDSTEHGFQPDRVPINYPPGRRA